MTHAAATCRKAAGFVRRGSLRRRTVLHVAAAHPSRSAARQSRAERAQARPATGRARDGARRPQLLSLRTRSGAHRTHSGGRRRPRLARLDHGADPRAAGDPLRLVPADHPGLPDQRRRLHCLEGESRRECQPPCRRSAHDRLRVERRRGHLGRSRRARLRGTGTPSVDADALPRHPRAHHHRQLARYNRCRTDLRAADLSLRLKLPRAPRDRRLEDHRVGRPSRAGRAAAHYPASRRGGQPMAPAALLRRRLHRYDGSRGGEQWSQRLP